MKARVSAGHGKGQDGRAGIDGFDQIVLLAAEGDDLVGTALVVAGVGIEGGGGEGDGPHGRRHEVGPAVDFGYGSAQLFAQLGGPTVVVLHDDDPVAACDAAHGIGQEAYVHAHVLEVAASLVWSAR